MNVDYWKSSQNWIGLPWITFLKTTRLACRPQLRMCAGTARIRALRWAPNRESRRRRSFEEVPPELPLSDPQSEEALEHSWRCRVLRGVLRVVAYEDFADVLDVSGVFESEELEDERVKVFPVRVVIEVTHVSESLQFRLRGFCICVVCETPRGGRWSFPLPRV